MQKIFHILSLLKVWGNTHSSAANTSGKKHQILNGALNHKGKVGKQP